MKLITVISCGDESNATWYLFNHKIFQRFDEHDHYTPIQMEKGKEHFQGSQTLSRSGEYDIVVEGHEGVGLKVGFDATTSYKISNLTDLPTDVSCTKASCKYENVSANDVFILTSSGGMDELQIFTREILMSLLQVFCLLSLCHSL